MNENNKVSEEWKTVRKVAPAEVRLVSGDKEKVDTREGITYAYADTDYVMRGIKGEPYPIKKDIFDESYEPMKIVCLCGSVRFREQFEIQACTYTLKGWIVVMPNCFGHNHFHKTMTGKSQKIDLDKLHFAKIRLADRVVIINKDGYIGESTRNELEYAKELGKEIIFTEEVWD